MKCCYFNQLCQPLGYSTKVECMRVLRKFSREKNIGMSNYFQNSTSCHIYKIIIVEADDVARMLQAAKKKFKLSNSIIAALVECNDRKIFEDIEDDPAVRMKVQNICSPMCANILFDVYGSRERLGFGSPRSGVVLAPSPPPAISTTQQPQNVHGNVNDQNQNGQNVRSIRL